MITRRKILTAVWISITCGQTATLTIWNQAWWFGLDEDAEVVTSNEPAIVPVGTMIGIRAPFVATFVLTHDLVIELGVRFPHEPEKVTSYLVPVDFSEGCVPVTTTTTAVPTTPSTVATAPPAPVVETAPVVTG